MADNITLNSGSGGDTAAADDIGGVKHQRVKLSVGADGTAVDAIPVSAGLDTTATGVQAVGIVAQYDDSATASVTENQFAPLRLSSRRALLVEGVASGTAVTVDGSGVTQPVSGTVTANLAAGTNNIGDVDVLSIAAGDNNIGNVDIVTVPAPLSTTGGGTEATALRVTVASDSTGVLSVDDNGGALTVDNGGTFAVQVDGSALTALQLIDNPVIVDDAAFTPATSSVMMAGFEADETATDSVDEGDAGAARMTLDRKVIVTPQPHTAGGLSIFRSIDLDESEEEVKASAGQVYGLWFSNMATSTRFLKFYNATAANVTVGTTTPVLTLALPGNSSDDISGVFSSTHGIAFDTAITVAATTGIADNDTGAPGANEVIANVFYK